MSDLKGIAGERIERRLKSVVERLRSRVAAAQSEFERRGVFHSSTHVQALIKECHAAYQEAAVEISEELLWWLGQSLYVTESHAREIIAFGISKLGHVEAAVSEYARKASALMAKSGITSPAVNSLPGAKQDAERLISLNVRKWRAENQRGVLRTTLSALWAAIRRFLGLS